MTNRATRIADMCIRPKAVALAAFVVLMAGVAGRCEADLIVVSGDENIANALVGSGAPVNPGNQRFFSNVLGVGTEVVVQGADPGGIDAPVAFINAYYNTLPGVTSIIQAGLVTTAALTGVDLFVSAIPASPFLPSEIMALSDFSAGGGSIFLLGDRAGFLPDRTANLNALLVGLGSTLRIVPDDLDFGFRTVGGSQIATNPLTTGVSSFTYAATSQVSGGTALFTTSGGQTFIAATGPLTAVPEPGPLRLAAMSLLVGAGMLWRRRRVAELELVSTRIDVGSN